jgi:endogenous inhibitor of DNA gyrase (YacG/DUF329 family)
MTTPSAPRVRKCPICGKPATEAARPFCSAGCKSLDLNRWLSGSYVVPASDDEEDATPNER